MSFSSQWPTMKFLFSYFQVMIPNWKYEIIIEYVLPFETSVTTMIKKLTKNGCQTSPNSPHSFCSLCPVLFYCYRRGICPTAICQYSSGLRNFILYEIQLTFQSTVTYLQSIHLLLTLWVSNKRLPFYDPLKKMKKLNKIVKDICCK